MGNNDRGLGKQTQHRSFGSLTLESQNRGNRAGLDLDKEEAL